MYKHFGWDNYLLFPQLLEQDEIASCASGLYAFCDHSKSNVYIHSYMNEKKSYQVANAIISDFL